MAIKQAQELDLQDKKISMLIAGAPGIGKTTLALSSPSPLLIDADMGLARVAMAHRKSYIQPATYDELLTDLDPGNPLLRDYETIVMDTGGQIFRLIASWVIAQNTKNGQADGTLSLKGYGAAGREFERMVKHCRDILRKNIIVVFHAKEEKEDDHTRLRLLVEGQTKDNIWQPMDLGGFIEMSGNKRVIGFSNCERYFAKGTYGITGKVSVPDLSSGVKNDTLTMLFGKVCENIAAEAEQYAELRSGYDDVIQSATEIIKAIDTPESANSAVGKMKRIKHVLTSEKEIRAMFAAKIKELGYKQSKGKYVGA